MLKNQDRGAEGIVMKTTILPALLLSIPTGALAQAPDDAGDTPSIIVTGTGLSLPPGTPAYGSVVIDRAQIGRAHV